jgi:serine/threonine protein kinase
MYAVSPKPKQPPKQATKQSPARKGTKELAPTLRYTPEVRAAHAKLRNLGGEVDSPPEEEQAPARTMPDGHAARGTDEDDPERTSPGTQARAATPVNPTDVTGDYTDAETDDEPEDFTLDGAGSLDDFSLGVAEPPPATGDGEPLPPKLGGYEVLKVLGKGGMGAVLLGRQISLDRKVAIKVMHPKIAQNPGFVARFTREAYAAAQLTHHNVVQIYDIGEENGRHFFSMEFVRGQSLMDLVAKRGKLTPEVAVGYILQAARGLRQGHNQGMVHRDIKPHNLLISEDGVVKVADLGLVKLPKGRRGEAVAGDDVATEGGLESGDPQLTGAGIAVGTPAFMAPEQATDSAGVDGRADVYSLGCTLYVLITGKPPFEGKTAPELMSKHLTEPVIPPDAIVKRVPKALSAILLRMLAKDPEERYQTMDDVIAALEHFLGMEPAAKFSPTEEQADQLEEYANQFHAKSAGGLKKLLSLAFFAVCLIAVVGCAFAGKPVLATAALGLMVTAPIAYFVVHGCMTGSVVFSRFRLLGSGLRFLDWLMFVGGLLLFLSTLYLLGLLWIGLVVFALAVVLAFLLWALTDKPEATARQVPISGARGLCKKMRIQGIGEESLREFVCKFSGQNWEPFFEALFGYEAKIAARALRKGETSEPWRKHGTWREPIIGWVDARLEARRLARERKFIQRVEAKALEAEGVSKREAGDRAAAMAVSLVDQAAEARKASKEGKQADLRGMVKAARSRKLKGEYNLAGKKLRSLWLKDLLDEWFGRRLRFVFGALLFGLGLLWMQQNQLFTANQVVEQFKSGEVLTGLALLSDNPSGSKPLSFLPAVIGDPLNSYRVPMIGLCLLISAVFFYGWRTSIPAMIGMVVGVLGPSIGVPEIGPFTAPMASLTLGVGLIILIGWLLRK